MIINYSLSVANMVMNLLKKFCDALLLPGPLWRFIIVSLHNGKLGQLPCKHKSCKQWLSLTTWTRPSNNPMQHIQPLQTHTHRHTNTQTHMKTQHTYTRTLKHLSFTLSQCQRSSLWQYATQMYPAGVGCSSDKLAWIKCQPWSRFAITGAVWGQVSTSS